MKQLHCILGCCLILALWTIPALAGSSAPAKAQQWRASAQTAAENAKITNLSRTMSEFERGDGVGEFIVMLKQPVNAASSNVNLSAKAGKLLRRLEVETVRSTALSKMPELPASTIQHRYDNIFGFSVKVTPEQLETILANPEVDSVEPVMILHAQLAQGIPLQGADTYRDQYNATPASTTTTPTSMAAPAAFPTRKSSAAAMWARATRIPWTATATARPVRASWRVKWAIPATTSAAWPTTPSSMP